MRWSSASWRGSVDAPTDDARECSSTEPRTGDVGGVTWQRAGTGPRPHATACGCDSPTTKPRTATDRTDPSTSHVATRWLPHQRRANCADRVCRGAPPAPELHA